MKVASKVHDASEALKTTANATTSAVGRVARDRGPSALRQFLSFAPVLLIVAAILGGWNWAQSRDDVRDRLWGEVAFFGLVIWFGIAVLSSSLVRATSLLSEKVGKDVEVTLISPREAMAWAAVTVIAVPVAVLHGFAGFAVLALVSLACYAALAVARWRDARLPRLPLSVSVLVGSLALVGFASLARDADLEDVEAAAALPAVPGAEDLAWQLRPLLFFDRSEKFPPVDISDGDMQGCRKSFLAEDCDPVQPSDALESFAYVRLTGTELRKGEKPGGAASAYYYHVVGKGETVFVDYWWYFAHNPAPVGRNVLCGQGLRWLSRACAEHPADWEGLTLVLAPCQVGSPASECVAAGGKSFQVSEVRYAQHEKVVSYSWEMLQERWGEPGLAEWSEGAGNRPLVFVALSSHASYAVPCRSGCYQLVHKSFKERRGGELHWTNNASECATDCLKPLPIDADGRPSEWNAFPGRWGTQHCILFGSYCDVQRAPKAPSFQPRYSKLDCLSKQCLRPDRL